MRALVRRPRLLDIAEREFVLQPIALGNEQHQLRLECPCGYDQTLSGFLRQPSSCMRHGQM